MASHLPETTRLCLRQLGRSTRRSRHFSSSARQRKNGPLEVFPATGSIELDAQLSALRTNVFIPSHLAKQQKHLVYRKCWQKYLTGEEPVQIELRVTGRPSESSKEAKESVILRPLSKAQDEPPHALTFNRILDLLASLPSKVWSSVLPSLLRELHLSGRKVTARQAEKLVRRASAAGQLPLALECLRRVETLGFRLQSAGVAKQLLLAAHERAANVGFGLAAGGGEEARLELDRAIKNAETTLMFAQDNRHVDLGSEDAPLSAPELFGAVMALIAVRRLLWTTENTAEKAAARQAEGKIDVELPEGVEENLENKEGETPAEAAAEAVVEEGEEAAGTVTQEPSVVFALGEKDLPLISEHGMTMLELSSSANLECDLSSPAEVNRMLERWLPVWFGIQVAQKVLPSNSQLKTRLTAAFDKEIGPQVNQALEAFKGFEEGKNSPRLKTLFDAYTKFL